MESSLEKRIIELENKIEKIYESVEKTRKYLFWTMIVTLIVVVLPIIGLIFAIPSFLNVYNNTINTLGI